MLERDWLDMGNGSRLSTLLGLKLDFLDRLNEMPPEFRDRRTLPGWITTFLRSNCELVSSTTSITRDLLSQIGFDPHSKAVETIITRAFSGNSQHHVEACEWAEIFIQDELKYNTLLSPVSFTFPFQGNITNSWFQIPMIANEEIKNKEDLCHVNILNLVTEESHAYRNTHTLLSPSQDGQNIVLFHGTDHLSATDILDRGIDLCAGRHRRDFSCGSGFYLTKHLDVALDWAKSSTAKPAILAYQVDRTFLDNVRKLNLFEHEGRWREIVFSFRSGQRTAKTRKSLISSYDLIEGPLATLKTKGTSCELAFEPRLSSHQMCLISDDLAEVFHQTLHSVVFLDIRS